MARLLFAMAALFAVIACAAGSHGVDTSSLVSAYVPIFLPSNRVFSVLMFNTMHIRSTLAGSSTNEVQQSTER